MQHGNPNSLIEAKARFCTALESWYAKHQRKLPWRSKPSLYKTVVSEFMLQQTQVSTVLPYFERWLKAFPNFEALAKADEALVLKRWEGLGYYSRARNLHKLAKELVQLPKTPQKAEGWLAFRGIGPYTAAAIASIAFSDASAVVDGNVIRILARLTADATPFSDNTAALKHFSPLAQAILDEKNPGDHNQAMMELGATLCTKHKPLCTVCPVMQHCQSVKHGKPENFPKLKRKATVKRTVERVWIAHEGAILLHKKTAKAKRLADLFEIPPQSAIPSKQALTLNSDDLLLKKSVF